MRILGGKYKGRKINAPQSILTRPLTNRIKESIFNTLDDFYQDKNILDLFAGSGSFGMETLSRGAASVTFVENSQRSIDVLKQNLENISIDNRHMEIIRDDVCRFCKSETKSYDLIFTDPPFNFDALQNLIDLVMQTNLLQQNGICIVHHEISNPIQTRNVYYSLFKQKRFGRSLVSYLIHGAQDV